MSAHSPGPWRWQVGQGHDVRDHLVDANGQEPLRGEHMGEYDANRRLIAAAPELLEALKSVTWEHDPDHCDACPSRCALGKARALIARVETP